MDFSMARVISFFLLFVSAKSAPAGHTPHDACTAVRDSALKFNEIAKVKVSGPKGIKNFTNPPAWMEAHDRCDPGTLRRTPGTCIKKMLDVLTSYKSLVDSVAQFESCSVARVVQPVLLQLHEDMTRCVKSRMEYHHHKVHHINEKELWDWEEPLLCQYTMERLFSFSILTARVFSVGDPTNHAEPMEPADSPKCVHKH